MPMNPRLLRPLASGWTPRQLPDLGLWLDASDAATVTVATGVSVWADKSGNGRNAAQAVGGKQPAYSSTINGKNVVTFQGTDDTMQIGANAVFNATSQTIIIVSRQAAAANESLWYKADSNSAVGVIIRYRSGTTFWHYQKNDASATTLGYAANTNTNANVYATVLEPAAQAGYVNGSQVASATLTTAYDNNSGPWLGSRRDIGEYLNGDVAEIIFYDRALTTAERQKIEGYLAWKWGLQSQLPYDHPYAKSFPGLGSQTTPTDADTLTYLAAVKAADGTGVEVGVANAVDAFVTGCKADGIWDAIQASCILAGARTLAGALVPLKGTAPTNNNFVSGDYNRETGLKGDGVSKSLFYSGLSFAQQADNSLSLFMTEAFTLTARWSLGFNAETSLGTAGAGLVTFRNSNSAGSNIATGTAPVLLGVSRSSASAWELFTNNAASTVTQNSTSTASLGSFRVFGQGASGSALSDFRLAFYHAGTSIDLSMLNARVSALITAIGAAI